MMAIPITEALYVYGDNMLVINNMSKPESTLKKKCNATANHAIHKSLAMGESLTGHLRSEDNPSDILTVVTGQKRRHLVSLVLLYDIHNHFMI